MKPDPSHNSATGFRIAIILASAFFGLLGAQSLGTYFPKQYRSSATMQINLGETPFSPESSEREKLLGKEIQFIQSKEILYPVIDSLELEKRWPRHSSLPSKEDTFQSLAAKVRISEIRNTELIQISATSTDPNEAAEIANAVTVEYARNRNAIKMEALTRSIKLQQDTIEKQQKKVDALRKIAATIRSQESEADRNSGLLDESREPTAGSPKYIEAQKNYLRARKLLEDLQIKLQTEFVNTRMPVNPAMIWEKAMPSSISISTPPIFRLTLGAFLGALVGLLLSLFIKRE